MATRGLVLIKKDNDFKVVQYNGRDSDPDRLGFYILDLLDSQEKIDDLKEFADTCKFNRTNLGFKTFKELVDYFHRGKHKEILTVNNLSFGKDSLYCTWAYLIDLDHNKLIVYKGGNKDKDKQADIFKTEIPDNDFGYYGCVEFCSFEFDVSKEEFLRKIYDLIFYIK